MAKTVRFDIEGTIIELPMKFDERSQKYLEDYREVIENPVGISGILPAHCWVCATTKKCAPVQKYRT